MTTPPTRRAFLGGAAALAVVSGRDSSGSVPAARTVPRRTAFPARPAGSPRPSDWAALAVGLSGLLVRPGEAGYLTGLRLFDPRFDGMRPAGIAYCENPRDVATCLAFARRFQVPVAARSGGHSYAGWSSTTGLIVDVTKMAGVAASGATATVGAGTRLIDLYAGLAARGRALPGGSCPTVGVAGLTLGGGIGVVGRAWGLTCDNLLSVQLVTADGTVAVASAEENPDLFWACRGGGGGNFGVATSFTFTTHEMPAISLFFLSWPWARAAEVIAAWQSWAPHAPDALWSNLHVSAAAGVSGQPSIEVGGTYLGSDGALDGLLGKLYRAVGSQPSSVFNEPATWLNAMLVEAGCASLTVAECHLPTQVPGGRFGRVPQFTKSDLFTRPLSSAAIGTLLTSVEKLRSVRGASGGAGGVAFDALGGAVNRVAPGATAFVHRNALFDAQYTTNWTASGTDGGVGSPGVANQHAWLRSCWQAMRPYASGQAYQNYIDPDLTNWRQAYYGANYARLAAIKARYDPGRLFSFPQAV